MKYLLLILCITTASFGQDTLITKANKLYSGKVFAISEDGAAFLETEGKRIVFVPSSIISQIKIPGAATIVVNNSIPISRESPLYKSNPKELAGKRVEDIVKLPSDIAQTAYLSKEDREVLAFERMAESQERIALIMTIEAIVGAIGIVLALVAL